MMGTMARLQAVVAFHCRQVMDEDLPLPVEAVGGQEHVVFDVHGAPEDVGLGIGAPCGHGTDPHGTTQVAAGLGLEKPLQAAVTGVVLDADEAAMGGEGVGHA
jgi:hypothetical protein